MLAGRGAVVTGAGRGIGAAIAERLAAAGAAVVLAARSRGELEAVAERIRAAGGTAHVAPCDVADEASVEGLRRLALARLGAVDILVNNAGVAGSAPLRALELAEWNRMLAVNATGTFLCTRAFLPAMAERGWGRVIAIASVAARTGAPYIAAYAASKHAVLGLVRCAALEVARQGVTVNAVCPGYVDTPMTEQSIQRIVARTGRSREEALAAILATTPQRRLIRPEEVAGLVLWLCSPEAAGVNGQALVLDGGGVQG
ncbi:MAG: 3-hydroxyacyl-CoA dehydrogenase [Planctomycetota bacterium]|nr:MAG: 3-hydroxyacyl-CoA dehydrogenase [Planctomycetota bacterium]